MGKTVLITGSTRGIGKCAAIEFAKKNYTVILNGTKETSDSKKLLRDIKKNSNTSSIYYFDVSSQKQVETNCKKIIAKYKKIDILINNAAIVKNKLFVKMSYEQWDQVIKTNLYGLFLITKQIAPLMIENNWGRIINMSSISGLIGDFGQTNYSTTKAGVLGFTKSLAKEVARYNITVNAICPGLVDTEILKDVPKEYMDKLIEKIPLGRVAKKEEIAKLMLFIASNDSAYITGECININGGWL